MITIIAVDEQNQQIKINAKSLVIVDLESFVCTDEDAAELLAQALQQNELPELAEKLKKLLLPIEKQALSSINSKQNE